jgi:hypothetical protein
MISFAFLASIAVTSFDRKGREERKEERTAPLLPLASFS